MLVIAQHAIKNPEAFWAKAKELTSGLPSTLKLHAVYPSEDMNTGICLWEAHTIEEVQKFLDEHVGETAKNTCYQVNISASMGLPETKQHYQFIN